MMSGGVQASNANAGRRSNQGKFVDLASHGSAGIITGVKVIWADSIIGFEFLFNGTSAGLARGSHHGGFEENWSLTKGDYIVEVYGRHSHVINCIGFKTASGYTKTWGNPTFGDAFVFGQQGHYIESIRYEVGEFVSYVEPVYGDLAFLQAQPIKFSTNGKFTEQVGKAKHGEEGFDDWDWLSSKFNYALAEVKVWHDGQFVHGIQFFYHLDGTKKSPGKHCSEKNGLQCATLVLNEGEHITKMLVQAGDWLDAVTFVTDRGQRLHAGGQGGAHYKVIAPENHHIVGVGGATKDHLENLRIFYDEIY